MIQGIFVTRDTNTTKLRPELGYNCCFYNDNANFDYCCHIYNKVRCSKSNHLVKGEHQLLYCGTLSYESDVAYIRCLCSQYKYIDGVYEEFAVRMLAHKAFEENKKMVIRIVSDCMNQSQLEVYRRIGFHLFDNIGNTKKLVLHKKNFYKHTCNS